MWVSKLIMFHLDTLRTFGSYILRNNKKQHTLFGTYQQKSTNVGGGQLRFAQHVNY